MINAYDLSAFQLAEVLLGWGQPRYRAEQVYTGLWRRNAAFEEMTNLPGSLRQRLATELPARLEVITEQGADHGRTVKALLRVGPERLVETVLMGYRDRVTVCVSSQEGCAMRCGFCATGQMGLVGSLTPGEIAAQVVWARRAAASLPDSTPQRVTNVVFMGMGEPMANYAATRDAIGLLLDPAGMNLAARHVTVSTVGLVPGIRRLAVDHPQVGLAVSLHAASDDLRSRLVPVNKRWPLHDLERAIDDWRLITRRRPSLEWTLMDGVNDDLGQASLLAPMARRLTAHVNLIPLNPTPDSAEGASPPGRVAAFAASLRQAGVTVTVRDTRGRTIDAACGQLRRESEPVSWRTPRPGRA